MISGLNFVNQFAAVPSLQDYTSNFHGRIVTRAIRGDQMVELAKIVASFAVIILSIVAVASGIYWLCCRDHTKEIEPDDDILPPPPRISFMERTPQVTKKKEEIVEDFFNPSPPTLSPLFTKMPSPVIPTSRKPNSLTPYIIDITATSHYDLLPVSEILPLDLIPHGKKDLLKQCLIDAFHSIRALESELILKFGTRLTHPHKIPYDTLLSNINLLGSFPGDSQNYELLVIQLNECLRLLHNPYLSWAKNQPIDQIISDPLGKLFTRIYADNLSFVFGALAEKHFNENHLLDCVRLTQKIENNSDLSTALQLAISRFYINILQFDQALIVLKGPGYKDEKEKLKLHIAKIHFNNGELDRALKIPKDMLYSKEKEELILNIAKTHFKKGDLDQALKIANDMTYSKEKEEFILNIAKTHYHNNKLDEALDIAKGLSYSKEKEEFILNLAKAHFNKSDFDEARKIAQGLTYSKERDEFIQTISKEDFNPTDLDKSLKLAKDMPWGNDRNKAFQKIVKELIKQNKLDKALNIAQEMSYANERTESVLQVADAYLLQKNPYKAFKVADNLSYSQERDAFIFNVARHYYRSGEGEKAVNTAESRSYSSERDELIKKMKAGLPL